MRKNYSEADYAKESRFLDEVRKTGPSVMNVNDTSYSTNAARARLLQRRGMAGLYGSGRSFITFKALLEGGEKSQSRIAQAFVKTVNQSGKNTADYVAANDQPFEPDPEPQAYAADSVERIVEESEAKSGDASGQYNDKAYVDQQFSELSTLVWQRQSIEKELDEARENPLMYGLNEVGRKAAGVEEKIRAIVDAAPEQIQEEFRKRLMNNDAWEDYCVPQV